MLCLFQRYIISMWHFLYDDVIENMYLTQEIFSILPFERVGFSTLANPMLKLPFLDELEKIDEL